MSKKDAEARAWATVNKESGGGKKSGSGRGKKENRSASKKGGKKGGKKAAKKSTKKSGKKSGRKAAKKYRGNVGSAGALARAATSSLNLRIEPNERARGPKRGPETAQT